MVKDYTFHEQNMVFVSGSYKYTVLHFPTDSIMQLMMGNNLNAVLNDRRMTMQKCIQIYSTCL